jgi:hypothetical protein
MSGSLESHVLTSGPRDTTGRDLMSSDVEQTSVTSTGRRSQPQSQPGCRTTHAKKRRPLDSSAAGFSTFRTLLAFYRSHNPPYQILVEGARGGWHVRLTLLRPPPVRCPAHPLTEGSVWVSSPMPALISSTYFQYWEYSDCNAAMLS